MKTRRVQYHLILRALMLMFPLFSTASGQQPEPGTPPGDLVPIEFELKRDGRVEIMTLQRENRVYLAAQPVLDFLRIKNQYSPTTGVITGFFVTPDTPYTIDTRALEAKIGKRRVLLQPDDLMIRGDSMYFRTEVFNQVFGLPVIYNPRMLKATLSTNIQLPVFLGSKIKHLESDLAARPVRLKPEATFERSFTLLDGGQLDYAFRQTLASEVVPRRSFSTRVTGTLLGGDADFRFLGSLSSAVSFTQTRARWRYVPSKDNTVRQYIIGDIISSGLLSREMYGLQLTNSPANPRIYFADERLAGQRETGRGVFLFEGNRISAIDRRGNGSYNLNTRLRFGVNYVDVVEFGDWGETYGESRRIIVPIGLIPPGQIDYDIKVGRMRDTGDPWHGQASTSWGVSSRVTAGFRTEYFAIETLPTKVFPELNLTARLTDFLIGETILSPNALLRGSLECTFPSLISASFSYTDFRSIKLFNPRNAINEMTGFLGIPFSLNGSRFVFDFAGSQTILVPAREQKVRFGLGAYIGSVSPRITTRYGWNHEYGSNATSLVFHETEPSIRARLPANVFLSVATPYDHLSGSFRNLRIGVVVQPLPGLQIDFQVDRNFVITSSSAVLRLQYIAPFTRVTVGATRYNGTALYDQSVSGSVGAVPQLGEFFFDNNPSKAGYGSMLIAPFVDANMNGVRDEGEPVVSSARLRASAVGEGGFKLSQVRDVGWLIPRAIPYQDYVIEMPQVDLENPLWIPRYRVIEANAPPGAFSVVSIPVVPGGVLRGTIQSLKRADLQQGVEFVKVLLREEITDEELARQGRSRLQRTAETFSNGDFEFIGVPPGQYTVSLDDNQLARMLLQSRQLSRQVSVAAKLDGDVVDGVNFILIERKLMFEGGRYK